MGPGIWWGDNLTWVGKNTGHRRWGRGMGGTGGAGNGQDRTGRTGNGRHRRGGERAGQDRKNRERAAQEGRGTGHVRNS